MTVSNNSTATHSIAELITEFHKTTGTVPPLLIGATTTLINRDIYLFGGRLQSTRQISNDLYILNIETRCWSILKPKNTTLPIPRYFHSASHDPQSNKIVFFGGMGVKQVEDQTKKVVPLNDLFFFDIKSKSWEFSTTIKNAPSPRYAHLSSIVKNRLVIMGGQDKENEYIQDVHIFDIKKSTWSTLSSQEFQYGTYRSAAVAVTPIELTPPIGPTMDSISDPMDDQIVPEDGTDIHIHIYSNTQTISPNPDRFLHTWKLSHQNQLVEFQDQSESINQGHTLPPPLKFPMAFMCGNQFILAGPHLSSTQQQFQIWALDITTMIWTKIEAGHALARGSWLRGMLCEQYNRFIVFGHPNRSMQDDYRERVHCFEYFACVDMEIFGIYRPPRTTFNALSQHLGLNLLKDPLLADLRIISSDNQHVLVNSALLAQRWPMIQSYIQLLVSPDIEHTDILDFEKRELHFPDSHMVLVAFLQYIYTDHLVTAQQHQPHILARLLFIADLFKIERLKALAIHSLHQMLNIQTATMIYESAALSNAVSLQIRALRVMINAKKMMQRQKQLELQKIQTKKKPQPQERPVEKTMKLPNFMRQSTSDTEPSSPYSSNTSSPKVLTPSGSSSIMPSTNKLSNATSFWRQTNSSSVSVSSKKKTANTPSKSESSRLPFFL